MGGIPRHSSEIQKPVRLASTFPAHQAMFLTFLRGIPPNESNTSASYTIPTARFNHDEYIMDSRKIAAKLEQLVPSSSLHVDSDMVPRVENLIPKIMMPLLGLFADKTVSVLLSPPSVEYFKRVQFERFGMPFAQLVEEHPVDWEKAAGVLRHFGDLLRVNAGTFLLGDKRTL